MSTATESFLSQLDKAAEGKSYNLIEFEGLLDGMMESTVDAQEVIEEESSDEIIEEVLAEEVVEEIIEEEKEPEIIAADMQLAMGELQGLFEGISGFDLAEPEPEPEPEPEIVLESIEIAPVEVPKPQIDPAILEAVTSELKGLFSDAAGYDLFAPKPEPEPEPEPVEELEPVLEQSFFAELEDLSISEKYAGLPIVTPKYEISDASSSLINTASGFMNKHEPTPKSIEYEKYDPTVAQGDANWQMDLFSQKNSQAARMVNDVASLLEKHKAELPEEEYKILEGNAVEQTAQYLNNLNIAEEEIPVIEESFDNKVAKVINKVLSAQVGWGQKGMTYGSGEVRLEGLDDVDTSNISATHQFLAWDASVNKFVAAEGTTPVGDIQGVTAGTGLSGGGNQGTVTLNLDVSELTAIGTTAALTDYVIIQDVTDNSTKKVLVSNLFSTVGDITGVTAGTGLNGGGTSGDVTINMDTVTVALGGTGITTAAKGSVLVANAANTFSALEGSTDGDVLTYNATSDTISWEGSVDGGTY